MIITKEQMAALDDVKFSNLKESGLVNLVLQAFAREYVDDNDYDNDKGVTYESRERSKTNVIRDRS